MPGAEASGSGTFGWAELNDRDVDAALPFYQQVFGWAPRHSGEGAQRYNLTFSVNFQNILNHVNLGRPVGNLSSSFFGQSTTSAGNFGGFGGGRGGGSTPYNRLIELSVRFSF